MASLGGSLLGYSLLVNPIVIPATTTYDKVTIYGEGIIDKTRLRNRALTEAEVRALNVTQTFEWFPDVVMYAEYNNDLSAGNVSGIVSPILNWQLFRRREEEVAYTFLKEFDVDVEEFVDYEVKNNTTYYYRLFAQSATEFSNPLDADSILTDFNKWSLIDETTNQVWLLNLGVNSSEQSTSDNLTVLNGQFGKFPYVGYSERVFLTSEIQFTAGRIASNGSFIYPKDYIDDFIEFIHNGNQKILKDRRGRGWKVATSRARSNYIDGSNEQIATLRFSYTQLAELES